MVWIVYTVVSADAFLTDLVGVLVDNIRSHPPFVQLT
jgi:hypothetical protein